MRNQRIPDLPAMEGRHQEFVQAEGELLEVVGQCVRELRRAQENYQRIAEQRQQMTEWSDQLQQVLESDARDWEASRRAELNSKYLEAQRALRRLNEVLEALLREMLDLNAAITALGSSPKKPEVAQA